MPELETEPAEVFIDLSPRAEAAAAPVTTVVPSSRWEKLDGAIGTGRERWRNLATVAVVVVALNVALVVLWTAGAEPPEDQAWLADPVAALTDPGLSPELGLQPAPPAEDEGEGLAMPAATVDREAIEAALAPPPSAVPSHIAYGATDAIAAAPAPTVTSPDEPEVDDAELFATNTEPEAVAEPAAVAEAPVERPEEAEELAVVDLALVDPEDALALARRAGCPEGSLPTRVLPGDTLRTIAWRHAGGAARQLLPLILEKNPKLRPERMFPGDVVCMPEIERVIVEYDEEAYTIRKGDTIGGLAVRFGHLSQANVRALTTRARKKDMLFAGEKVRLPMPRYASL